MASGERVTDQTISLRDGTEWNLAKELRLTVVDLIRGDRPSTVLGYMMSKDERPETRGGGHLEQQPVTREEIAGMIGRELVDVEAISELLIEQDLASPLTEHGLKKVMPYAFYTDANGRGPDHVS
jgi:hypothetical protein